MLLYHISPSCNYTSILNNGLLVSKYIPRRNKAARPVIFLTTHRDIPERLYRLSKIHKRARFDIYEIAIPAHLVSNMFSYFVSYRDIDPRRITHVRAVTSGKIPRGNGALLEILAPIVP